jgi:transcriptional regulator with XRE-family HTH domain
MTTEKNMEKSYLDEFLGDSENWIVYEQERLANAFGDLIESALESKGDTQAIMAERLGKSPSVISRALNAGSNLTLRTMVELSAAVGYQILGFETQLIPSAISAEWAENPLVGPYVRSYVHQVSSIPFGKDDNAALAASSSQAVVWKLNAAKEPEFSTNQHYMN